MKMKKLPVGIDNFSKLREQDFYYADKTGLIRDLLTNWSEVSLFTRPRRFGKTLNMDMLRCFFEIGQNRSLFDGLLISKDEELCREYMGRFPVIFISLKGVSGADFAAAREMLRTAIGMEAQRFSFLKNSPNLEDGQKDLYRRMVEIGPEGFAMSDSILVSSLHLLSDLLSAHHAQKVILLIDEYDVPLDKAYTAGYYDEMIVLIRGLMNQALKSNENLLFAVLTGCPL